jgi:hypothetical protein
MYLEPRAASIVQHTSGLPAKLRVFLWRKPFEPARAPMNAKIVFLPNITI